MCKQQIPDSFLQCFKRGYGRLVQQAIPHHMNVIVSQLTIWCLHGFFPIQGELKGALLMLRLHVSMCHRLEWSYNSKYQSNYILLLLTKVSTIFCVPYTFRFGTCEQYEQASELCDAYFNETDYVYIPNTRTQSEITATLRRIPTANISATAECQDNVLRIICHNFYVPCGRNGIPTSICQEECSYVRDTCQTFWDQAFQAIESELDRINCESPGSALSLLPSCCTGAGISILLTSEFTCITINDFTITSMHNHTAMPTTSTSEATSSQVSAPIIGGSIGGALILIIMLLVLVVIIAAVVMRGKRAAVQNLQIDVIAK